MPVLDVEKLKRSKGERIDITCTEKLPQLPLENEIIKPLREAEYELSLTNVGNAIFVDGTAKVELLVQCNRCLNKFVFPIETQFQETYYDRSLPQPGGIEIDWVPFAGEHIDITPEVIQSIMVNLPMRFICREDCRGLCSICGANLNNTPCNCKHDELDPRMIKLGDLLK